MSRAFSASYRSPIGGFCWTFALRFCLIKQQIASFFAQPRIGQRKGAYAPHFYGKEAC